MDRAVFVLMIMGISAFLFFSAYQKLAVQSWPSTEGYVVSSKVIGLGGRGDRYGVALQYTYSINGQSFSSSQYAKGRPAIPKVEAVALEAKYREVPQIVVYYNPERPTDAVVYRHSGGVSAYVISGIVFAALALMYLISWYRARD